MRTPAPCAGDLAGQENGAAVAEVHGTGTGGKAAAAKEGLTADWSSCHRRVCLRLGHRPARVSMLKAQSAVDGSWAAGLVRLASAPACH